MVTKATRAKAGPNDKRRDPQTQRKGNLTKNFKAGDPAAVEELTAPTTAISAEQQKMAMAMPVRRELARRDFAFFLDHVQILDTSGAAGANPVIPFAKWPHLLDVADAIHNNRLLVVLKSRQIGISWLLAAWAVWRTIYNKGVVGILISKSQLDATTLLEKCRFIHANLPIQMQSPISTNSATELAFDALMSKLIALSSTENAGRGETATFVVQDEADFHEYLDANYAAIRPTIDAGGRIIMASTPNKAKVDSLFKRVYREAPENEWAKRFLAWNVRPGRDDAWYMSTKNSTPTSAGMDPELYMEQEYPETEQQALRPARTQSFFDLDRLSEFATYCTEPIESRMSNAIRIWRKPVVAGRYVAGADVAWGTTGAYCCLTILDWRTSEQVAEVHGRFTEDEYAQVIYSLCNEYNSAYVGVENNGEGINVLNKLVELGYRNRLYYQDHDSRSPSKPGWHTDIRTRPIMLGEMAEIVRNDGIRPRASEAVQQMADTIRDEKGVVDAAKGGRFDRVMSWAIALQMRHHARFHSSTGKGAKIPWTR